MNTSETLSKVRKLSKSQTKRLKELLKTNPRQSEIEAFLSSCQVGETSPISTVRKIQNSQLSAALSLMDWSTSNGTHGMH